MRVASMGSVRPSSNATGLGFQLGPKLSPIANSKHHHHQSLGLGSNLSPSPLLCMGKPKAAISSWASPSDEVSTVSDIDERKRMAALRWQSCCRWDLAHGTGLQSPPAALGRQQKKLLLVSFTQQKEKLSVERWPNWLGSGGLPVRGVWRVMMPCVHED